MLNLYSIDKSNYRKVILDFPKQFKIGIERAAHIFFDKFSPSNVVICGMGGSGLAADLLEMIKIIKIPVFIHKNYGLPLETNKNSLIICISYSGNTEETISSFKEAIRKKFTLTTIASGGKILKLAEKSKIPFVKIPTGIPPRCSIGYNFSALLKILSNINLIDKKQIDLLLKLEKILISQGLENQGKNIAEKLIAKIPLIYSSEKNWALARIWKIKINENSKIPSFFNIFPELNHNEMISLGEYKIKKIREIFKIIILEDKNDDKRILKRMKVSSKIFKEKGIETIFIEIKGGNIYEKIFSNLLLSDWVSYYLALFGKTDPAPVKLVEEFKKKLKK